MKKSNYKLGCLYTAIIIAAIVCLSFIVVVGGPAAIDKVCDKLTEYKDSVCSKTASAFNLKRIENETVEGITNLGVIEDTLPKPIPKPIINITDSVDSNTIKIKLEINDNMMYIRPKINGVEMRFLLDTGCADIHLTPVEVLFLEHQKLLDSKKPIGTATCIYADGQGHECVEYMLKSVELGGIKIESVKCTSDPEGGSADDYPLFGQKMLSSFGNIMINYSDSTLIIKKK